MLGLKWDTSNEILKLLTKSLTDSKEFGRSKALFFQYPVKKPALRNNLVGKRLSVV